MNIINLENIGGSVVKQDDRYIVRDNEFGNNLVIMELDKTRFTVKSGDVVPINDGVFHKVYNDSDEDLYFVCVFNGNRVT